MATKEPWNNEIYRAMREEPDEMKRQVRIKDESKRPLTTRFLTFLVVMMFMIVGAAIVFILWNSQVQSNASIAKNFHQTSTSQSIPAKSSSQTSPSSTTATSSSSSSGGATAAGATYTIVTGDYPSTIASKTGISWDKIASLNNISADGYNADGSAIHAGQVLKLK